MRVTTSWPSALVDHHEKGRRAWSTPSPVRPRRQIAPPPLGCTPCGYGHSRHGRGSDASRQGRRRPKTRVVQIEGVSRWLRGSATPRGRTSPGRSRGTGSPVPNAATQRACRPRAALGRCAPHPTRSAAGGGTPRRWVQTVRPGWPHRHRPRPPRSRGRSATTSKWGRTRRETPAGRRHADPRRRDARPEPRVSGAPSDGMTRTNTARMTVRWPRPTAARCCGIGTHPSPPISPCYL